MTPDELEMRFRLERQAMGKELPIPEAGWYSAKPGGTTVWTDEPERLGVFARIKRWWRGGR